MVLATYTGIETCPKCGYAVFSISHHKAINTCPLEVEEHMHLTCGKCGNEIAVAALDTPA